MTKLRKDMIECVMLCYVIEKLGLTASMLAGRDQ